MRANYKQKLGILLAKEVHTSPVTILEEMAELEDWAYKDPKTYREVRHDIQSGKMLHEWGDHPLYKYAEKYGDRSLIFGTYCKIVSVVRVKESKMNKIMINTVPPAFDPALRATVENPYRYDVIISHASKAIRMMRNVLNKWRDEHRKRRNIVLLNNNSSMSYQVGSVDMTDVMCNICTYDSYVETRALADLAGLVNDRSDNDPFVYISHDQYSNYNVNHLYVPDKDGKIREVYQCSADVQIISKALHELFHEMAISLPGNYTKDHKGWVRNLIKQGWNRSKLIVTTDMSKYSDTLDRAFILAILQRVGFTSDEIDELDILYSLPVYDKASGKLYRNTLATYQGQYGDFPLITIANIVLQMAIYEILGERMEPGYNAAVGDDTGFVFEHSTYERAMKVIVHVYGSVGVNINKIKTGYIDHGKGRGDFVKLTFDAQGILPFMEVRSFWKNNTDQIIRDIYDNDSITNDRKEQYFSLIFGKDVSKYLMHIHKINGGLRCDRITVDDIIQLIDNTYSIISDLDINDQGKLVTFLEHARKELNSMKKPDGTPYGLRDTCLFRMKDRELKYDDGLDKVDDSIILGTLAIAKIGLERDIDYIGMVGCNWKKVEEEAKAREDGKAYDPTYTNVYDDVSAFFQFKGKYQDKLKGKACNSYLRHYDEYKDPNFAHRFLPFMDSQFYELDTVSDYRSSVNSLISDYNSALNYAYKHIWQGYTGKFSKHADLWYYTDNGTKYRLYSVRSKSNIPLITQEVVDNNVSDFKGMKLDEVIAVYRHNR